MKVLSSILSLLIASAALHADATADARGPVAVEQRALEADERAALVELRAARARKVHARRMWDAAVAGGHPVDAGRWAPRHWAALRAYHAAVARWQAATARVRASRIGRR